MSDFYGQPELAKIDDEIDEATERAQFEGYDDVDALLDAREDDADDDYVY